MKITASILFAVALFAGTSCSTRLGKRQSAMVQSSPVPSPSDKGIGEQARYTQAGLPFEVSFQSFPEDPDELKHMKQNFLQPLAGSQYAQRIKRVVIDAPSGEWYQWKCWIKYDDYLPPISLTHYAGFYDGSSNRDPDSYAASRSYVLRELNRIGGRLGWK